MRLTFSFGGDTISILIYKQRFQNPNYKRTPKNNYAHIGYIATRPGAVKNEGMRHGLFGKLKPGELTEFESWRDVARKVRQLSDRKINIYRSVISFTATTAAELGLTTHKTWEEYIDSQIHTIAERNGIGIENLGWAAAHHAEDGHPHCHIVFWDNAQQVMKNYVNPKVADGIRIKLIKDTFADRIEEYYRRRNDAKSELSEITDDMVNEFSDYMKSLRPDEYRRMREFFGRIDAEETNHSIPNRAFDGMNIAPIAQKMFTLKDKLPKSGRLAYKFMPEDIKRELDELVQLLKTSNKHIRELTEEYAAAKCELSMLYNADPENIQAQWAGAALEADKMIANRILGCIKELLGNDCELRSYEYSEERRQYYAEQMVCEILKALESAVSDIDTEYGGERRYNGGELSKAARREWYLRHKDKGMEV